MPLDMESVDASYEDVPDTMPYVTQTETPTASASALTGTVLLTTQEPINTRNK